MLVWVSWGFVIQFSVNNDHLRPAPEVFEFHSDHELVGIRNACSPPPRVHQAPRRHDFAIRAAKLKWTAFGWLHDQEVRTARTQIDLCIGRGETPWAPPLTHAVGGCPGAKHGLGRTIDDPLDAELRLHRRDRFG